MAEILLSTIIIYEKKSKVIQDHYECFFDDDTEAIIVRDEDGNLLSSGVIIETTPRFNRVETGYAIKTIESGVVYDTTFPPIESFPYVVKNKLQRDVIDGDPNDDSEDDNQAIFLTLFLLSSESPTTETSSDGTIVVSAATNFLPVKFFINKNPADLVELDNLALGQDTGSFSGLGIGDHTVYAVAMGADNPILNVAQLSVSLEADQSENGIDYGVKWRLDYEDLSKNKFRIDILKKGFVGSITTVKGAGAPGGITTRGEGSDIYEQSIISSNININLISQAFDTFKELATSDEREFIAKLYFFNGVSYDFKWNGFITPSSYRDVLADIPYQVNISANDRLGDLKAKKYLQGKSRRPYKGRRTQLKVLHDCLSKLNMGLKFRIACNIFAEDHTILNRSPLDQTLMNTDVYNKDKDVFCDEVVKDILNIYGASLFNWEGYWYVVRQKEWSNVTIDYIQYTDRAVFELASSWNPRVEFGAAQGTNRARFIGGAQGRSFTSLFGSVKLTYNLDLKDKKGNLLNEWDDSNFEGNSFKGFSLVSADGDKLSNSFNSNKTEWNFDLFNNQGAKSYIRTAGNVFYNKNDSIELEVDLRVTGIWTPGLNIDQPPPYAQMKWELVLNGKYIGRGGNLFDDKTTNIEFVSIGSDHKVSVIVPMIEDSPNEGSDYVLKVFVVDLEEYDVSYEALGELSDASNYTRYKNEIVHLQSEGLQIGARLVGYYDDVERLGFFDKNTLRYYELRSGSFLTNDDDIRPFDTFPNSIFGVRWALISSFVSHPPNHEFEEKINGNPLFVPDEGWKTRTSFKGIKFNYKKNSENDLDDEFFTSETVISGNNVELNRTLNQFDLVDLPNGETLVKNFLTYDDDDLTPTSDWISEDDPRRNKKDIQIHLFNLLVRLSKRCRAIVNGNFRTDGVIFTPINILVDSNDENRLYLPTGVSSAYKMQSYSGELIEFDSDDDVPSSAFTSGFNQDAVE